MDAERMEELAALAKDGSRRALEELMEGLQGRVFNLSLRMLGHRADAEDASQEILIKVLTHLGSFRGEAALTTWVHRIAINHIFSWLKQKNRRNSFEAYGVSVDKVLTRDWADRIENRMEMGLMAEEMLISCVQGMLMCLSDNQRLAYILGDIFHLPGEQAAEVLEISPAAYRQRFSRAKKLLFDFMRNKCSLVNPDNPCTCRRMVALHMMKDPDFKPQREFVDLACKKERIEETEKALAELSELKRVARSILTPPEFETPAGVVAGIKEAIFSTDMELVQGRQQ